MSAVTVERPILAYSDTGKFDFETVADYDGVNDWVLTKYLKITGMQNMGMPIAENTANQWNAVGVQTGVGIVDHNGNPIVFQPAELIDQDVVTYGPLLGDIAWNQRNNPKSSIIMYNNNVRYNNCADGIAPVGCGAVAMGQIMKYYNYPNMFNITNMHPYITATGTYAYNTQPAYDIADFLEHISTRVNSYFYCDRSGGASPNVVSAFSTYYHYSTSNFVAMDLNIIKANVIDGKPVYLRGNREMKVVITQTPRKFIGRMTIGHTKTRIDYDLGHAWVGDGYEKVIGTYYNPNQDNYFSATIAEHIHLNWGWGGRDNGWFDYDLWEDVDPFANPINNTSYIYNQQMIYNITPN